MIVICKLLASNVQFTEFLGFDSMKLIEIEIDKSY